MSAGGLSYSGLRTKAKATLPSVEMWSGSMNILKDPPKGIHTRRIDKVGQTQSILTAQDESGDRISDAVQPYARGVNPMVAVSFDNYSNNGGRGSPFQHTNAVSLPYKVQTVRPPIQRQEDLLPLSRLPRNYFYAYTNPEFPDVVQATQCNETKRTVRDDILHPNAAATKTFNTVGHVPRDAASRTIHQNIPHMQTDTNLALPQQTYLSDHYDTGAEKNSINFDKTSVVAMTNRTSGDVSRQSEFDSLSAGKIGQIINIDMGTNKSSYLNTDKTSDYLVKDPKQIHWNKKVYEAFTQKSLNKSNNIGDNIDTNKFINKDKYLCIAKTNKSSNEHFVNPMENADVSTIPTKDYLYNNVKTQATSVFQMPQFHEKNATNALKDPIHSNVKTSKTFIEMNNTENNGFMTHSVQDSLLSSADTTKSFIASKNAFQDSIFEIHNDKRTPIHSMQTNNQSPYSMPLMPETILEQRRVHPLMETSTVKFDPVQIEATRNAYHIQSRDGNNKIHPSLNVGGFEGNGNAVPVFNQYDNYNYAISDPQRQALRQRTVSIMEGRYDAAPVFT
jgi:hypothetical protein